jgi:hypothetical protein
LQAAELSLEVRDRLLQLLELTRVARRSLGSRLAGLGLGLLKLNGWNQGEKGDVATQTPINSSRVTE